MRSIYHPKALAHRDTPDYQTLDPEPMWEVKCGVCILDKTWNHKVNSRDVLDLAPNGVDWKAGDTAASIRTRLSFQAVLIRYDTVNRLSLTGARTI